MASDDDQDYVRDSWPKTSDGEDFDGFNLLNLVRAGSSPFKDTWNVNKLLQEIEAHTLAQGLHMTLSDQREILVRLGRSDVNMLNYKGFPLDSMIRELDFESAVYALLAGHTEIPVSALHFSRPPIKHNVGTDYDVERSVQGRQLMVFDKHPGKSNVWWELSPGGRDDLISQAARIRASLFKYDPPRDFLATYTLPRIFPFMPAKLPVQVEPTREFWLAVFRSKLEATIKNEGDMIGWEDDNNTVGEEAMKAKQSLLRFLPHMLPSEEDDQYLYRMVLEHGDFGIHNMSIVVDADMNHVHITSLYDWETGCIWPALLADPEMALAVDLIADDNAKPAIKRVWEEAATEDLNDFKNHTKNYIETLYHHAPDFERVIKVGKDAHYLWFKLKDWRGDDPEDFFGELGAWAERRMAEMGVPFG
ncbi:hypothetical protein FPOA_11764 [Fusarium poae]|uniref:Aminoglycoside phosphotransferase domain-containing protein n=1 Tax=Fusarium poae TaxID=36050 RepID=A0A1B8AHK9_FUSPO|nr:hypothetical protein FPOA_11764 [Fusarium poae]